MILCLITPYLTPYLETPCLVIAPAIVITLANNFMPSNSIPRDFTSSNYASYSDCAG